MAQFSLSILGAAKLEIANWAFVQKSFDFAKYESETETLNAADSEKNLLQSQSHDSIREKNFDKETWLLILNWGYFFAKILR